MRFIKPLFILIFVGCVAMPLAALHAADPATYAYVLLGQGTKGTVAMARAVIAAPNRACPSLTASGQKPVAMTLRSNPNPATFPVTVCEAIYPAGKSYSVGGIALPKVDLTATPDRVVVVGDSGCKNSDKQPCDPASWPFASVLATAAAEKPNLLVHVGDYNYRGTPSSIAANGQTVKVYDAGDADDEDDEDGVSPPGPYYSQNMIGSSVPDSWAPWQADFFAPAGAALSAAPWVFTRGNHELCSRAGPGFLYFLDQGSSLPGAGGVQNACPNQNQQIPAALLFLPPFQVAMGNLSMAVVDTANADDTGVSYRARYNAQLETVVAGKPNWVITHRPFWGIMKGPGFINATLQTALAATKNKAFPSSVTLVVSGHMHRFQAMGFDKGRPPQFIVGTGGVAQSKSFPKENPFSMTVDGQTATGVGLKAFSLMRIDLGKKGAWTGKLKGTDGKTLADCRSDWAAVKPAQAVCVLK